MSENVINSLVNYESLQYYDSKFLIILMDHKEKIKTRPGTFLINVDLITAQESRGDLFFLFRQSGISPKLWGIMMILNDYTSPEQYDGDVTSFIYPDTDYIDELYQLYRTVNGNV